MIYAIDHKLSRLIQKCAQLKTVIILLLGFIAQLTIMLVAAFVWKEKMAGYVATDSRLFDLMMLVVLGPILETLIFQYAIIDYIITRFKSAPLAILISAAAFGLTHVYSPQYILATFASGLLFAFLYLVFRVKNQKPILYLLLLHSGFNLFIWLMRTYFS